MITSLPASGLVGLGGAQVVAQSIDHNTAVTLRVRGVGTTQPSTQPGGIYEDDNNRSTVGDGDERIVTLQIQAGSNLQVRSGADVVVAWEVLDYTRL